MKDDDRHEMEEGKEPDRMGSLYDQANALKMLNLGRALKRTEAEDFKGSDRSLKSSRAALQAMMLQLRILREQERIMGQQLPESLEVFWEAMTMVPRLKRHIGGTDILEEIVQNLEKIRDRNERASEGEGFGRDD